MSTSPETSQNPSPSNNEALSDALFCARTKRKASLWADYSLAAVACAALLIVACYWGWTKLTSAPPRPVISYDAAMPGDETTWCVDNYGTASYTEGKPSQALLWTNAPAVPNTQGGVSGARCIPMNVKIVERGSRGVTVEYQGRP